MKELLEKSTDEEQTVYVCMWVGVIPVPEICVTQLTTEIIS